jgi:Flp pilus assembly CpaE family ATPase
MSASPAHDPDSAPAAVTPGRLATIDRAGRVVAVRGAHGGASTTTAAAHLAGAWAR